MFANRFTALIDACVLADALRRNILLSLAEADLFRPRWSREILDETRTAIETIMEKHGIKDFKQRAAKAVAAIDGAFQDATVVDYDAINVDLSGFPDAGDHHVIAAAIKTKASIIVTENLKDFPNEKLAVLELEAKTADEFIADSVDLKISQAIEAIKRMRLRLDGGKKTPEALLRDMERRGLMLTADLLKDDVASI